LVSSLLALVKTSEPDSNNSDFHREIIIWLTVILPTIPARG
jgi:hypothetical protein